jgi:predicted nuclease with TOPRIM domain
MSDSRKKFEEMKEENPNWESSSTYNNVNLKYNTSKPENAVKKAYPEISEGFSELQKEQLNLFSKKMMDYGLGNIALGGNLNSSEDKNYALQGIQIRLNDKVNRLKNLFKNGENFVKDESIEDTFMDIANYGIIGLLLLKDKWK